MGKKGKKAAYADWEDDLGQDISGQNETSTQNAEEVNETGELKEVEDPNASSNKKSKKKKGKKNQEELPLEEKEPVDEEEAPSGPVELSAVTELDDDEFAYEKPKKGKKNKKQQVEEEEEAEESPVATPSVHIKSKKEKEREKKEREKLKKKQQGKKQPSTKEELTPGSEEESVKSAAVSESDSAKGKQGKRKGPNVAALQKMLEEKKAQEEEERKQLEEEERLAEEEKRLAEEEERQKEEAKEKKKEKERKKKEELKAQGKYVSKKQREQQAQAQRRLQQMLESGVQVSGLSEKAKKPKPVYTNKKKSIKSGSSSLSSSGIIEPTSSTASAPVSGVESPALPEESKSVEKTKEEKKEEADAVFDDWEAALEQPEPEQKPEPEPNHEEVKEEQPAANDKKTDAQRDSSEFPEAAPVESEPVNNLRSPICCILGHVDTGKTKLLDNLRRSHVQEGEAGGITQQIGATYFPIESIKQKTTPVNKKGKLEFNIPGLLIIDTPGHESFTNLRSRGTSLCNIAILVIDIMHGLEPQTMESIRLLRDNKTPFVVALNKVDRLYGWHSIKENGFQDSLSKQKKAIQREFRDRVDSIILQLNEQGLNAALYFENKKMGSYVSLVPTSAQSGEGVPDLVALLVALTQTRMSERIKYISTLECTVLEVKVIEGLGATIDVILSNGVLREGDRIVLCGMAGPIITTVRALLTPQPMKEMRIKSAYVHHKEIRAAMGVKICANDLDRAVAGSRLLVAGPEDDEEDLADELMGDLDDLLGSIDTSGVGVSVQASTLGSLEALLEFLKQMKIPVASVNIGPVYKKDVMKCATMVEKAKEYALLLCFDVKVDHDAELLADQLGVKVFSANVIYHLFDAFTAHQNKIMDQKRDESSDVAVFPCVLNTIAAFNKRDPIILGVDVVEGVLRKGTPIVSVKGAPGEEPQVIELGRVVSLEMNHKPVERVKKGQAGGGVAMKLEAGGGSQVLFGRHVTETDTLYSHITRESINALKDPVFRNEVHRDEWQLIIQLKKVFGII